jgi:DNA-directed RNA polymerase subunit RPC12/RpoP
MNIMDDIKTYDREMEIMGIMEIVDKGYICERCGYKTNFLGNLKRHLQKNKSCDMNLSDISVETLYKKYNKEVEINKENEMNKYNCEYCNKSFTTRQGKSQHKKICKQMQKDVQQKRIIELEKKVEELSKIIEPTTKDTYISVQGNNNTTNSNNTNYNIQINAFGKEDISYIKNDLFKVLSYIKKNDEGVLNFIEDKHFNEKYPEKS